MEYLHELTNEDIEAMIRDGELPTRVRLAADRVVVILTQDWCPQWHDMQRYLPDFAGQAAFFYLIYNTHADFERIMAFKEDVFNNREIPYIRYYVRGELITEANWLPRGTFAALLKRDASFKRLAD